ncbi:MAG: hypothetical protein ACI4UH_00570 [Dorea sp.]
MKDEKKLKQIPRTNEEIIDSYDYLANAASCQDCTGLIPANPTSKEELEAYEDVYHFLPPQLGT